MASKNLLRFGIVTYAVLILLTLLFYKERMVFNDAAFHLFAIFEKDNFAFQNYRFVAIVTQSFPLIAASMGLPLSATTMLYSFSFELFYFLVFLILLLGFKNRTLALAYLLFCTLMVRHTFYWCLSEIVQGVSVYFLYLAVWMRFVLNQEGDNSFGQKLILLLFLVLLLFCHPLMPVAVLFGNAYFYFYYYQDSKVKKSIVYYTVFYIAGYVVRTLFFRTDNDATASGGLLRGLKMFPHIIDIPANRKYLQYFLSDYVLVSFLALMVTFYYLKKKRVWPFLLFAISFIGYSFIVNISEPQGPDQFYVEYRYLPLSLFVIFPFVYELLPNLYSKKWASFVVYGFVFVSIFSIVNLHHIYQRRTHWHQQLMQETANNEHKKLIIKPNDEAKESLQMYWGVPYEMWLLSTIETGHSRSVIIEEQEHQFDGALNSATIFQTPWGSIEYKDLKSPYFQFRDTILPYIRYNLTQ